MDSMKIWRGLEHTFIISGAGCTCYHDVAEHHPERIKMEKGSSEHGNLASPFTLIRSRLPRQLSLTPRDLPFPLSLFTVSQICHNALRKCMRADALTVECAGASSVSSSASDLSEDAYASALCGSPPPV